MKMNVFERIVFRAGLALLVVWGVARTYWLIGSRISVDQFDAETSSESGKHPTVTDFWLEPAIDFRLWSTERIKAHNEIPTGSFGLPLAILRIPSVDLEAPVFNGTDDLTLDRGVGRIPGTARIGQTGNLGIAGHRDGFFRSLKDVKLGDAIKLTRRELSDEYIIGQIQIVEPGDVSVLGPTPRAALTLVTCFPFYYVGSAPQRYIVTAFQKDSEPERQPVGQLLIPIGQKHK